MDPKGITISGWELDLSGTWQKLQYRFWF